MANVFVNEDSLSAIADAIRDKLNTEDTYKPGEMADAIESISGGSVNNQNKTVHPSSSDQSITADSGYTGLGTVSVKAVTMSNLSSSNIVQGVTVKIGDADDDDRIASVVGSASGGITPTGTKTITANGTGIDVYSYASADVSVPNSYSAGDEGKVVSNGALVSQGSDTVTQNGTVDTTLINSLTVNVSGGSSVTAATGTVTLASDLSLTTTPTAFPGLQLSFVPDFFVIMLERSSFDNISTPANAHIYLLRHTKKTLSPPYRIANNVSTDSNGSDYYTEISTNVTASTDVTENGMDLNGVGCVGVSYQERFYFDSNGYFYVGRFSTSASYFYAGTYRYFAFKI